MAVDQPDAGITEAEHDRLLTVCLEATTEPWRCPAYVDKLVDATEADGGDYRDAAEALEEAGADGDQ